MRKFINPKALLISLAILFVLALFVVAFVKNYVGDVRPAFLPPKKDIIETIERKEGEPVSLPLNVAKGFKIGVFAPSTGSEQAKSLGNARDLQFSPGGTLLVSVPSEGKVLALPDKDKDGRADKVVGVLSGLDKPHGLAFHKGKLFVAELTRVARYSWNETSLTALLEKELFKLPYNGGHSTRSLAIDSNGHLFVSIGSSCNVCFETSEWLAAVIASDVEGVSPRLFAKGLRNSVFIKLNPVTSELWGTEMGRDFLGDNLPPEEINIIREGKDYGWPTCYGDRVHDEEFEHNHKAGECDGTQQPIYEYQAHSAPLGLVFVDSKQFPVDWQGDLLVSYHGSWNRTVPTGYKIVRMHVDGNKITQATDFITGFLQGSNALGRPVDLEFDSSGSLYISDDKIGVVYKVIKK